MNYTERLKKLIKQQNGTILSADLDYHGIPRVYLQKMVSEGKIVKMDRGVYVSVDAIEDEMYALQKKYPKLIYSHETALYVHGLSDRTPFEYSASVPSGYKVVSNISERCKIYYIKKELHGLGVSTHETSFGNPIQVYNLERTICDIIRSRNRMDDQIFNSALRKFVQVQSTDYSLLMEYARALKLESVVTRYLEVLI